MFVKVIKVTDIHTICKVDGNFIYVPNSELNFKVVVGDIIEIEIGEELDITFTSKKVGNKDE